MSALRENNVTNERNELQFKFYRREKKTRSLKLNTGFIFTKHMIDTQFEERAK